MTDSFRIAVTVFNGKENVVDQQQAAWSSANRVTHRSAEGFVPSIFAQQKRENLLINDVPEIGLQIDPILGNRNEFYAMDLKVDPLAVPKTGDEVVDRELGGNFKANYPLKYKLTEPGLTEKDLRKQGLLYVLCFVHAQGCCCKRLIRI